MENTLQQFLDMLSNKGIVVESFTPDKVVWENRKWMEVRIDRDNLYSGNRLPTKEGYLKVYDSFFYDSSFEGETRIVLKDMIEQDRKILAIKIIRAELVLELREAKDLVFDNWDAWRAAPECRKIDQTPQRDLPLLIGSMTYPIAEKYLEEKLRRR